MTGQLGLGVALDGYGWHPQAWRTTLAAEPGTASVLSGRYWAEQAVTAERGLLDFLTIDDTLMPQNGRREQISPRRLAGRADAVLIAARIAPATQHIGLIPVATVTHTEPFHVSKAIATLDYVSHGRAGWQPRVSSTTHEAALFGRRDAIESAEDLFDEAADFVEVVRRLWDSWEDDAVIRDVATGRFIDRDKLHYIDFTGKFFSVKGPSITPRPPQGQPVVAVLAHAPRIYEFAAAGADIVFITPADDAAVRTIIDEVRHAGGERLNIYADVVVAFGGDSRWVRFGRKDIHRQRLGAGRSAVELAAARDCRGQATARGQRRRPSGDRRRGGAAAAARRSLPHANIAPGKPFVNGWAYLRRRIDMWKCADEHRSTLGAGLGADQRGQ